MTASFAQIRRAVPSIHVFIPLSKSSSGGVTILAPSSIDHLYENRRYSESYSIEGDGSRDNPYTYESVAQASPHYGIIDLWFKFHELTKQANSPSVFIEINDWILQIGPEGVTSEDGHFTKLS